MEHLFHSAHTEVSGQNTLERLGLLPRRETSGSHQEGLKQRGKAASVCVHIGICTYIHGCIYNILHICLGVHWYVSYTHEISQSTSSQDGTLLP